jgi:hypothetical protein
LTSSSLSSSSPSSSSPLSSPHHSSSYSYSSPASLHFSHLLSLFQGQSQRFFERRQTRGTRTPQQGPQQPHRSPLLGPKRPGIFIDRRPGQQNVALARALGE